MIVKVMIDFQDNHIEESNMKDFVEGQIISVFGDSGLPTRRVLATIVEGER